MFARIATFEIPPGVTREVGDKVAAAVRERMDATEPPAGAQRVLMLADPANNRALNITFFDSQESMEAAESFFEQMQPVQIDDAPSGRRTDVARYEVYLDHEFGG